MRARFEGELDTRHLDEPIGGKWFMTLAPLAYIAENGQRYDIPIFTYTDFASVPKGLRWLISRIGKQSKPSVLHDWLCDSYKVSRKEADKLFLEAMKTRKVGWLKRRTMYFGVRSYSILTFKK